MELSGIEPESARSHLSLSSVETFHSPLVERLLLTCIALMVRDIGIFKKLIAPTQHGLLVCHQLDQLRRPERLLTPQTSIHQSILHKDRSRIA